MQRLRSHFASLLSKASKCEENSLPRSFSMKKMQSFLPPSCSMQTLAEASPTLERPSYLKTKKLTKTAAHIMQILDKESVTEAKAQRPIPELKPGDVVQLRVEVPDNKRRVSSFRGIVMAIRRSGLQSTFRIRRFLAGVGVELLFPLYSPNIKEMKVLEHRRVRRNKLYYMREKLQDKRNKIT